MGGFSSQNEDPVLQLANILRRRTFGAGDNAKAYPITFGQGFETLCLNRGMMHKNILAAVLFNKAKPL